MATELSTMFMQFSVAPGLGNDTIANCQIKHAALRQPRNRNCFRPRSHVSADVLLLVLTTLTPAPLRSLGVHLQEVAISGEDRSEEERGGWPYANAPPLSDCLSI